MAHPALRDDPQVIPLPTRAAYPVTQEMVEDDDRLPEGVGIALGMIVGAAVWTGGIGVAWWICRLIW